MSAHLSTVGLAADCHRSQMQEAHSPKLRLHVNENSKAMQAFTALSVAPVVTCAFMRKVVEVPVAALANAPALLHDLAAEGWLQVESQCGYLRDAGTYRYTLEKRQD